MKRGIIIATAILLVVLPVCKGKSNEEKIEELEKKLETAKTEKEVETYAEEIERLQQAAKENAKKVTIKLGQPFSFWASVDSLSRDMTQFSLVFENMALNNEGISGKTDKEKNKISFMILAKVTNLGPRKSWSTPSGADIQIKTDKGYLYRTNGANSFFSSEPPFPLDWKILNSWKHEYVEYLEPEETGWIIYNTWIPEDSKPIEVTAQFPVEAGSSGGRKLTIFNLKITQTGENATKTEKQKEGETPSFFQRLFRPWWTTKKDENKESSPSQKQLSEPNLSTSDKTSKTMPLTSETSKSRDAQTEVTKEPSIGETLKRDEQLQQNSDQSQELRNLARERMRKKVEERRTQYSGGDSGIRRPTDKPVTTNMSKSENETEQVREIIKNKISVLPEIPKYLDVRGERHFDYSHWYQIASLYQGLAKSQLKWADEVLSKGDSDLVKRYIDESDKNVRMFHSAKSALDAIYQGNAGQADYYKKEVYENSRVKYVFPTSYTILDPFATVASDCLYAAVDFAVNSNPDDLSLTTRQVIVNIITKKAGDNMVLYYNKTIGDENFDGFDEDLVGTVLENTAKDQGFRQTITKSIYEETKQEITDSYIENILLKVVDIMM